MDTDTLQWVIIGLAFVCIALREWIEAQGPYDE